MERMIVEWNIGRVIGPLECEQDEATRRTISGLLASETAKLVSDSCDRNGGPGLDAKHGLGGER